MQKFDQFDHTTITNVHHVGNCCMVKFLNVTILTILHYVINYKVCIRAGVFFKSFSLQFSLVQK